MDAIIVTQACEMILVKFVAVKNFPLVVAANMMNRPINPKNGISFLMAAPDFCSFFPIQSYSHLPYLFILH